MKFQGIFRAFGIVALVVMAAGCDTPSTRSVAHAGTFTKLSAADQRLVLAGKVRHGMKPDAVYIAWGTPDEKRKVGAGKEAAENWLYHRQLTVKAPLGSFDRWSVGNSVFGMTVPLAQNAGYGYGGIGNEGGLLYQPHLQIADATVKEANFLNGELDQFRVYQGQFDVPQ